MQVFGEVARSIPGYSIRHASTSPSVISDQGLELAGLEPLPPVTSDTIVIVPGIPYRSTERLDRKVIRWVRQAYDSGATLASVCTGAFVLGEAGLLEGRRCTTHWSRTDDLERRFPKAEVIADRLFVTDGRVVTSAGIASGIDMSLALVEQRHGPLVAAAVAREMVVYLRRDGSQEQTSVYLDYRTHLHPGVHRVQDSISRNPGHRGSLDQLAELAGMSRRGLTRSFKRATGITVNEYASRCRLELAKSLLHDPSLSVEAVARRCGFSDGRQLRRLWRRTYGASPRDQASAMEQRS